MLDIVSLRYTSVKDESLQERKSVLSGTFVSMGLNAYIPPTGFHIFPVAPVGRVCLKIKTF